MSMHYGKTFIKENHTGVYSGENYSRIEFITESTSGVDYQIVDEHIEPVRLCDANFNLVGIDLITVPKMVVRNEVDIDRRTIKVSTVVYGKKFEGVAKCHEDDEFDAGIGFQIAISRMEIAIQEFKMKRVMNLVGGRD